MESKGNRKQIFETRSMEIAEDDDDPDPSQFLECAEIIEGEVNIKTESVEEEEEIDDDPGFVGVQSVPRNDIPTISLQNSIESNTSSSNENISTSSSSYNSAKAYRSYVNSISTTHIVDNVKIYVKNIGISNKGPPVHLDCPCCTNMEAYTKIGHHLKSAHSATHIDCPGSKCSGGSEIPSLDFTKHLMENHMNIICKICSQVIRAYNMIQHMKHSHPYTNNFNGKNSQTKPKNKKIHVPVKTITPESNGKLKSVVYEVFQNGELVIVDGIHYFVKRKVAFIDCPMCVSKSMALTMIEEHIKTEHNLEVIKCPANPELCNEVLPWHELVKHLISNHGRVPCEFCSLVLLVPEMYDHLTKNCRSSHFLKSKSNNESMSLNSRKRKKKSVGFNSSLYKLNEKAVNLKNQKITKIPKISQKSFKDLKNHNCQREEDEENNDVVISANINLEQSVTMDLDVHTSEIGQSS